MVQRVRDLQIAHADSDTDKVLTISIGGSARLLGADADPAGLLALSDAQPYRAKHSGCGRSCGATLPRSPGTAP